jgi:inosine/xanthosine triphosphate pyrophosphatase family protein
MEDAGSASKAAAEDSGAFMSTVSRIAACGTPAVEFAAAGALASGASERIDWIASVAGLVTPVDDSDLCVLACDASQDPGVAVKSFATGSVGRERERVEALEEERAVEL